MNARAGDPNIDILTAIATALGELREEVVLVGGCAAGLLVTSIRAQQIRMTEDVDVIVEVASLAEYQAMERRFEKLGFAHDLSERAPICRWTLRGLIVDLLPTAPGILGFHNRWYPIAVHTAQPFDLGNGLVIRLITAPLFIATKLEAFKGRGRGNYLGSHDLEDIITIVDGRAQLEADLQSTPKDIQNYLAEEFTILLSTPAFVESISGHLPPDRASQMRAPGLTEKLRRIAGQ